MASSNTAKYSGSKIAPRSDFRVGAAVRENVISVLPVRRSARLEQHPEARAEVATVTPVARSLTRSVGNVSTATVHHLSPPASASRHPRPLVATGKYCDGALTQAPGLRAARESLEIILTVRIVFKRCDQRISPQPLAAARERECDIATSGIRSAIANCTPPVLSPANATPKSSFVATRRKACTTEISQIRILQLTMMRSNKVSGEVLELISNKGLDVLLLQEPYIEKQAEHLLHQRFRSSDEDRCRTLGIPLGCGGGEQPIARNDIHLVAQQPALCLCGS